MDSPPPEITPLIPADNVTTAPPPVPSSTGEAAALPPSNSSSFPSPPSPTSSSPSGMPKETLTALVVGIGLGGLIVLIAVGIFVFFYRRKKRKLAQEFMLPTKHNPFGGQAQQYQHNVPPSNNDVGHQQSKSDRPPGVSPKLQSPQPQCAVVPIPPSTSSSLGSEKSHHAQPPGPSLSSLPFPNGTFTYEELASATDNFSGSNLLGQGGFGYVHKGFLPNGKEIAVKQLKTGSVQGEREFQAEVETISRVHHRHLVSLVGHCMCGEQRMLVYEFISNKTLEYHLHGYPSRLALKVMPTYELKRFVSLASIFDMYKSSANALCLQTVGVLVVHGEGLPPMSWGTRLKIALGAAKGLAYLHEDCHPKIIHRDIKASNILIDDEFEAKVADFGLAKFSFDSDTHVSTRVMGTFGYLAPEYASSGKLTEKSDVFSFGIVLLELITGRRPVDKARPFMDDSMVEWARPLLTQALEGGSFSELVDRRLEEYDSSEMAQMIACAAVCVRSSARRRPLMSQVVRALEGNLSAADLLKEIAPDNRTFHGSSDYDSSAQYKEDLKKFRKLALESQEQSTGEYSVFTNEHGAPPSTSSTENQHDTQEIETGKSKTGTTDVVEILVE